MTHESSSHPTPTPDIARIALDVILATDGVRLQQGDLEIACCNLKKIQEPLRRYLDDLPQDGPQAITLTDSPWGPVTITLEPNTEKTGGSNEITLRRTHEIAFRRTKILRVV